MPLNNERSGSISFLLAIVILQIIVSVTVLFNIPVVRQVICFFYFTLVPGYVVVKLLKFRFGFLETVVFSAGFSLALLMFFGLVLNELNFIFGILKPLSTIPLLLTLNFIVLLCAVLAFVKGQVFKLPDNVSLDLIGRLALLASPIVLSIVGTMFVNVYGDNRVLLAMICAIALITGVLILKDKTYSGIYALAVFIFGVSLLYHSSLISNYLSCFGSDLSWEHFVFQYTQLNGHWTSTPLTYWDKGLARLNNMLSITILSTTYSNLLNLDSTWTFKLVFPLIFAFVPTSLYQVWKEKFGDKHAFISAFFFMATSTFYTELLGLNRQMIGELFFALLFFILVSERMNMFQRVFSFTILGFGLVVSHYALAEVFIFFIAFDLTCSWIFKRRSNNLTTGMFAIFFSIMFAWYIFTSNSSVFEAFLEFGDHVARQLGEFFNIETREAAILRGLGLEAPPTFWNAISRVSAYVTEVLIVIGFMGFALNKKTTNREWEHYLLIIGAMGYLVALIVVPGLSSTLNMTRFYHLLLFFLAPLCVLGAEFIAKFVSKKEEKFGASILLLLVLVSYFLFQTGFVYEIVKTESWSVSLSGYRMGIRKHFKFGVITEQEVLGARWLAQHNYKKNPTIHAGFLTPIIGYGNMDPAKMFKLTNLTRPNIGEFVYLGKVNTWYGMVVDSDTWNTSNIYISNLWFLNPLYSSGECEIYVAPKR